MAFFTYVEVYLCRHFGVKNENNRRTEREMQSNKVSADAQIKPPSSGAPGDGVRLAAADVFGIRLFPPNTAGESPPALGSVIQINRDVGTCHTAE